jgi:hypothetical protein
MKDALLQQDDAIRYYENSAPAFALDVTNFKLKKYRKMPPLAFMQ